MIRRRWRSLGFYWQVYIAMVLSFGGIIMLVEGMAEPFVINLLERHYRLDAGTSELVLWIVSVLVPTLALGFILTRMVMRKMAKMAAMATRLSHGDLAARIDTTGNENDAFAQLARVFNEMAESLERLLAHEKRLLADISHELRSPLTRMGIAAALLPMKREPGEVDAVAKILEDEISRMNTLVALLLERGRERLRNQSDYSRIPLAELVRETVRAHSLVASAANKCIRVDTDPDVAVWGHAVRLRMILDNILSNAEFYSPADGEIAVRVWQDAENVRIAVRDLGPGVPETHLRDIFRAFFRVDRSRARTSGGVGLGLALARDAAVAMGGDIEARNAHPGLEIVVTLPRVDRRADGAAFPAVSRREN